MRKTIKKARAKLRPMALSIWWKIRVWLSGNEWNSISRNLGTQGQSREVYPNIRKFQVLTWIFDLKLNSVECFALLKFNNFRIFGNFSPQIFLYNFLSPFVDFRNLRLNGKRSWFFKFLIVDIYSKYITILCFLPILACRRAILPARVNPSHRR